MRSSPVLAGFGFPALLLAALLASMSAAADPYSLQEAYLGEAIPDQFGFACAAAGDVNGDGFDDFLASANVNDEIIQSGGKVYLYLGGEDYPPSAALAFAGEIEKEYVGGSLAAGDLNNDGYDDWVVGAPGPGPDGLAAGRVYVFLGDAVPDAIPDLVLAGEIEGGQFGEAVCVVPDLDGDGYGDLAVGAPRAGDGTVTIYRGGEAPLDGTADRLLEARPDDLRFGKTLAFMPDLDGDGRDELLVGAARSGEAAVWAGAVLLYEGSADLDPTADLVFLGENAGDEFGRAIAAGADLDGDGEDDLVVGAPFANANGEVDAGKVYFFRGGALLDSSPDLIITGDSFEARLGLALAAGFDWDGDEHSDLILCLADDDANGQDAGACLIYQGGPDFDAAPDETLLGPEPDAHLGRSAAFAGDLRHNGRGALLVGGFGESNSGRVLLFGTEDGPIAVGDPAAPPALRLAEPWPNPANPSVVISFTVPSAQSLLLEICDLRGRRLARLAEGVHVEGRHELIWRGEDSAGRPVASGVYLIRLRGGSAPATKKLVLIR